MNATQFLIMVLSIATGALVSACGSGDEKREPEHSRRPVLRDADRTDLKSCAIAAFNSSILVATLESAQNNVRLQFSESDLGRLCPSEDLLIYYSAALGVEFSQLELTEDFQKSLEDGSFAYLIGGTLNLDTCGFIVPTQEVVTKIQTCKGDTK